MKLNREGKEHLFPVGKETKAEIKGFSPATALPGRQTPPPSFQ